MFFAAQEWAPRYGPAEATPETQPAGAPGPKRPVMQAAKPHLVVLAAYVLAGVAAGITILAIPYPGVIPALLVSALLGGLVVAFMMVTAGVLAFLVVFVSELFRPRRDPRSVLLLSVYDSLEFLADGAEGARSTVLSIETRRRVARLLERAARHGERRGSLAAVEVRFALERVLRAA